MMFSDPMTEWNCSPVIMKAIDRIFTLHADHEQNASTSTVRIAGSSLANPFACVAAGIASLWGPAHGGASESVLQMLLDIGSAERIPEFIRRAKDKNDTFRLMGFGHRVYKNFDPRSNCMRKICYEVLNEVMHKSEDPLLSLAVKLEETALKDDYFVTRKLFPNVDFYTGLVYKTIGIPREMYTVMFAVARAVGWISQWMEMMAESNIRIGRPRQLYVGNPERTIPEDNDREETTKVIKIDALSEYFGLLKL